MSTTLTFLGTGTSQGVPVISCPCCVCSSPDRRDKRLRSAAMVEHGATRIIIDAGPDFRQQMLREDIRRIDGILLTHEHKDHIAGLDDVRAFNYTSGREVALYAEGRVQRVVKKDFDYAFSEERYPGVPDIRLVDIGEEPFRIGDMEIIPIRGRHYRLPVLGFRIGGIAYLTDFNGIESGEMDKLRGVEALVVNALRREPHISHFTLDEALHISASVGAQRTYITHISHQMGRHDQVCCGLPDGATLAYDGLKITSER